MFNYCRLHESSGYLTKGTVGSAGYDISSSIDYVLKPNESKLINTGISVAIDNGWVIFIKDRSGIASKHMIRIGAGVIDSDYRGEVKVLMHNMSSVDYTINLGDRIAQLVPLKTNDNEYEPRLISSMDIDTTRGIQGFGSTGI